jgi:hypothetical protein
MEQAGDQMSRAPLAQVRHSANRGRGDGRTIRRVPVLVHARHLRAVRAVVTEAEEVAIRTVYEQRSEFAAALGLRRLFPAITDNAQA